MLHFQNRTNGSMNGSNRNATSPLPCTVSISPFSVNRRRLSTSTLFVERSRPVSSERPMAWISLQGRLVNGDEASSARTIGGGLTDELAFAWNLFPPIHRFLIVAVIGAAASTARSQKNQEILNLKKSVELRDQVLSSMQEKLDDLCEQLNISKENTVVAINELSNKDGELQLEETFGSQRIKFVDCGCWHCEEHSSLYNGLMDANSRKASSGNEVLQYKSPFSNEEQEERRMSDWSDLASSVTYPADIQGANSRKVSRGNVVLQYKSPFSNEEQEERRMSDWSDLASSVTSAADIQSNNLAIEQDIYNLKRDCEEKETTINELTTQLNSSEIANSKRVAELEDVIKRKNTTISKLKKDMGVLEQKVMQLTRLRRPSFSANILNEIQLPQMRDNLIYDMDSTTSPSSSSDSDSSPVNNTQNLPADVFAPNQNSDSTIDRTSTPAKIVNSSGTLIEPRSQSRYASPLQEVPIYHKSNAASSSSSQKQLSPRKDLKKSRRRSLTGAKTAGAHKRWV